MVFEISTGYFKVIIFHELCATVQVLPKMISINAIAFVVLKALDNLFSMQKFLQVTADVSKITRKVLIFIFTELSVLCEYL